MGYPPSWTSGNKKKGTPPKMTPQQAAARWEEIKASGKGSRHNVLGRKQIRHQLASNVKEFARISKSLKTKSQVVALGRALFGRRSSIGNKRAWKSGTGNFGGASGRSYKNTSPMLTSGFGVSKPYNRPLPFLPAPSIPFLPSSSMGFFASAPQRPVGAIKYPKVKKAKISGVRNMDYLANRPGSTGVKKNKTLSINERYLASIGAKEKKKPHLMLGNEEQEVIMDEAVRAGISNVGVDYWPVAILNYRKKYLNTGLGSYLNTLLESYSTVKNGPNTLATAKKVYDSWI